MFGLLKNAKNAKRKSGNMLAAIRLRGLRIKVAFSFKHPRLSVPLVRLREGMAGRTATIEESRQTFFFTEKSANGIQKLSRFELAEMRLSKPLFAKAF